MGDAHSDISARRLRRAEDTVEGCRANAAADLVRAAAAGVQQMRIRMENSAAVWSARADLLGRLEASFQARRKAA
jgi:hypothetical protein